MADQINLTQSAYAKIENGDTKLTIDRLYEISKTLEIDLSILLQQNRAKVFDIYDNEIGNIENLQIENKKLRPLHNTKIANNV